MRNLTSHDYPYLMEGEGHGILLLLLLLGRALFLKIIAIRQYMCIYTIHIERAAKITGLYHILCSYVPGILRTILFIVLDQMLVLHCTNH